MVEELEPSSSSAMRALEREDSSSTEDKNTTIVYVPCIDNKSCDKNENVDTTICDGELESLDNIVSILPDADTNLTDEKKENMDSRNIAVVESEPIGVEPSIESSPETLSFQSTNVCQGQQKEECDTIDGTQPSEDKTFSSEGEQSGDSINTKFVANNNARKEQPEEISEGGSGHALLNPQSCPQVTNEQSNTCTKALTSQPPSSQNIVFAQKGELREQRKSNLGECNDVFFDNNPALKNIFPKRKISTMGELMDEVHPLVLVLCYLLACLANHTGVDFVTVLGILLTLISMISMIFI